MPVTSGMIGHGFYNRNSAPQLASIAYVLPWLDDAVGETDWNAAADVIGLADFGCSEGKNSVRVMQHLIAACRKASGRPIQTIHSDLPTNDFSELFLRLNPDPGPVFEADNVYSAAIAGSMYKQLLPPGSVDVATTFNAIGFLTQRPMDRLPGYILPNGPSKRRGVGDVTVSERAVFAAQAAADLQEFAKARAGELVPGGKLLIQVFGAGDDHRTCDGIYDVLNDSVLDALGDGMITQQGYDRYYQPVYFRTLQELTAPFIAAESGICGMFELQRAETYEVPVSFVEDFAKTKDIATYAAAYTNFFRAFTEAVFRMGFSDHPDLDNLVRYVYERCEQRVRDDPQQYEFHYVAVAVLLTKTA